MGEEEEDNCSVIVSIMVMCGLSADCGTFRSLTQSVNEGTILLLETCPH